MYLGLESDLFFFLFFLLAAVGFIVLRRRGELRGVLADQPVDGALHHLVSFLSLLVQGVVFLLASFLRRAVLLTHGASVSIDIH